MIVGLVVHPNSTAVFSRSLVSAVESLELKFRLRVNDIENGPDV